MAGVEDKVRKCYEEAPFPDTLSKAKDFDKSLRDIKYWITLNLEFLSSSLVNSNPKTILCAGCGTGEEAIVLALIFPKSKIDAVDISEKSLLIAKQNIKKAKVKNINFKKLSIIEDLPKFKKKYDLIFSAGVIHHLTNPQLGFKLLSEKLNHISF